jgi:alkylation response protein AidB-like acyl-CoA dehydrogenase
LEPTLTEEHEQLRAIVRKFCDERSPESAVREQMATARGYDEGVWRQLAQELGLLGLAIPEEHGGAGLGPVELAVTFEEMGRALLCAPYFSTVALATHALLESGDAQAQGELLPAIAAGERVATLAWSEGEGRSDLADLRASAARDGGGWRLDGAKLPVVDGCAADQILVVARAEAGLCLFLVEADAPGLRREPLPPLDLTRKLARLELEGAPGRLVGPEGRAAPALERALDLAAAALAAEQVGGAQRCLDMAVAYARERVQFGRPIGSFQAIKHKCANVLMEVEAARSAAYHAAFCAAAGGEGLRAAASMAKAWCSDTFFHAASENIQIHGGIGFTWEHPAHLYLKRAKSSSLLLGDPVFHRDRLACELGL